MHSWFQSWPEIESQLKEEDENRVKRQADPVDLEEAKIQFWQEKFALMGTMSLTDVEALMAEWEQVF